MSHNNQNKKDINTVTFIVFIYLYFYSFLIPVHAQSTILYPYQGMCLLEDIFLEMSSAFVQYYFYMLFCFVFIFVFIKC